jgi:hypothetical protein
MSATIRTAGSRLPRANFTVKIKMRGDREDQMEARPATG